VITREEVTPASPELSPIEFHDTVMVEGTAQRVVKDLHTFFSKGRLEAVAREGERQRLARELHDGVLQALAGAALQLHALSAAGDAWPDSVCGRLKDLEALLVEQQSELRGLIETLKPPTPVAMATHVDMQSALRTLCDSVSRCGVRVHLSVPLEGSIPRRLGDQIYRLVQEGLSNAVRHSKASSVRVDLFLLAERVRLVITDDGCGFPFQGSFDLKSLNLRSLGPVSIKERVASQRGELLLDSAPTGSRLTIILPRGRLAGIHLGARPNPRAPTTG